jgi:hypothetical protein
MIGSRASFARIAWLLAAGLGARHEPMLSRD